MKKTFYLISFFIFASVLFSCGGKGSASSGSIFGTPDYKPEVRSKVFSALKCDSNTEIIGVSIGSFDVSGETINFTGSYKGEFGVKYDGTFNGYARIDDNGQVEIRTLNYENPVSSGKISTSCF